MTARFLAPLAAFLMASCSKDEMADTPRFEPMEESSLFANGTSARQPPAGSIARDDWSENTALYTAVDPATGEAIAHSPLPYTRERMEEGRDLFNIHCALCHGQDGYAKGIIVRRGFPSPPSYHTDRLRHAPDGHIFDVISNGYGQMYPFRGALDVSQRWAIVSYIRALQRGQLSSLEDVTDGSARSELEAERSSQ